MKVAIITGATSFIGTHLIEELINNKFFIYAIIRPNSKNKYRIPINKAIKIIEIDMNNIHQLQGIINKKIDVFFHLAWEGVRAPMRDDTLLQESNYIASISALDVALKLGVSKFIVAGSQAEYGNIQGEILETAECNPTTQYGIYKLKTYMKCKEMVEKKDISLIWVRIFSVYGEKDYSGSLIMSGIKNMLENNKLKLSSCQQNWDYIYIKDLVKAFVQFAILECDSGIYNLASGDVRPLKSYVLQMKEILKSDSILEFSAEDNTLVSIKPNIDKVIGSLGMIKKIKFEDGIRNILENDFGR